MSSTTNARQYRHGYQDGQANQNPAKQTKHGGKHDALSQRDEHHHQASCVKHQIQQQNFFHLKDIFLRIMSLSKFIAAQHLSFPCKNLYFPSLFIDIFHIVFHTQARPAFRYRHFNT